MKKDKGNHFLSCGYTQLELQCSSITFTDGNVGFETNRYEGVRAKTTYMYVPHMKAYIKSFQLSAFTLLQHNTTY